MKFLLNFFLLFILLDSFAQTTTVNTAIINKTEDFILDKNLDSAKYYLKQLEEVSYKNILSKIVNKETVSYNEYYDFIFSVSYRHSVKYKKVSNFIEENISEPQQKKIDIDFVEIKWVQVYRLRDELSLDEASSVQKKLEAYVNKFNDADIEVLKAKTKITTHPIVMFQIQQDHVNGKALVTKSLEIAKKLNDKELQIIFLYHLSDILVDEGKLQEYIDISEKSLQLGKELSKKSVYYYNTMEHLIDAYVFKGGNNERVVVLINELYNNKSTRINTYTLYAKLVSSLAKNSPFRKEVFNKFEVKEVTELVSKFKVLGKDLPPNDFFHLLIESSNALAAYGYFDLALNYKDKAIRITRKIYSQQLSESLANYKTEQAVKVKEKEIAYVREKTTLYGIIASLAVVLFIISLLVLTKIRKQSKELSEKNKIIKKALKDKELLIKEVHHRVKNNFQIVSSLLELQTKGIEDEKALELANQGKNRVNSMALIHQKLYQNESGLIDFDEYIRLLIKELSTMYSSSNNVNTSISSDKMMFDVDTAIPLGLIINEIITNSYKYAFRNDKENNLSISIHKEDNDGYKLVIEDNGPGLANDFDARKAKSLGLRLVNRLVKQLHGTLEQTNNKGAKFEIYFKGSNARQLVN